MWLKSAPTTGPHNSKHREDNIYVLKPIFKCKSSCVLSHREVRKGVRVASHSSSQKNKVWETAIEKQQAAVQGCGCSA